MTDTNQKQLGTTLWSIADQLRGAMDADDLHAVRALRSVVSGHKMNWKRPCG